MDAMRYALLAIRIQVPPLHSRDYEVMDDNDIDGINLVGDMSEHNMLDRTKVVDVVDDGVDPQDFFHVRQPHVVFLQEAQISGAVADSTVSKFGFPNARFRKLIWDPLAALDQGDVGPWLLGGDFNGILHFEERIGCGITIRPPGSGMLDRLLWNRTLNGQFQVKSAFEVRRRVYFGPVESVWSVIARFRGLPKVRTFLCTEVLGLIRGYKGDETTFSIVPHIATILKWPWRVELKHVLHEGNKLADSMKKLASLDDLICHRFLSSLEVFRLMLCRWDVACYSSPLECGCLTELVTVVFVVFVCGNYVREWSWFAHGLCMAFMVGLVGNMDS
ncbi:hypothetical protein V6N11_051086 [Hibiscus sabdariffa]|uniref:RNase H type-1 domain-containing protein n=1 Tax=Hibiscus sabdariffa TaxID=183260 RepID=A0ABR2R2U3_9ROSI